MVVFHFMCPSTAFNEGHHFLFMQHLAVDSVNHIQLKLYTAAHSHKQLADTIGTGEEQLQHNETWRCCIHNVLIVR